MARSTTDRLAAHQARYRQLAERITEIGFIQAGSITQVHNRCGKSNCRCHADPPRLHGPYWRWTAKANGKTVSKRLNDSEARLYQQWIANDRELRDLIAQMRQVAAKATELIMKEAASTQARV